LRGAPTVMAEPFDTLTLIPDGSYTANSVHPYCQNSTGERQLFHHTV
jgi:hypothetical protein